MEDKEIDQLPPSASWVVLDTDAEPITIQNVLNSPFDGIEWNDVDDEAFDVVSSDSSSLDGSTASHSVNDERFDLLQGENVLETFQDVRMQFRGMNLRRDGRLSLTNFRIAFIYNNDENVQTCKFSAITNTSIQFVSAVERLAPCPRSSSPNRAAGRADFGGSGVIPSNGGKVLGGRSSDLTSSETAQAQQTSSFPAAASSTVTVFGMELKTKDFRKLRFYFRNRLERDRAMALLQNSSSFSHAAAQIKARVFAYAHAAAVLQKSILDSFPAPATSSWVYNIGEEFARLKFDPSKFAVNADVNYNYALCSSYPRHVILPTNVSTAHIQSSSSFRGSGRFPVVCWIHPQNSGTISRCSQPQVGIRGSRDAGDEALVGAIFGANPRIQNTAKPMYIIDCRPQTAAAANYIKGAGYENTNYYTNCKLMFMNIQNIHAMRSSYKALSDLCARESGEIPDRAAFESTKWLDHIQLLLKAAVQMAKLVHESGSSLLVHCSDGWDRTPQLVSLVQLLLDPYYRTIKGFCVLIQKEWLAYGHKFTERLGLGQAEDASPEISPIFIQWLDCIFQITSQFPNAFEFTEEFLIAIVDQVFANRFGNFLGNCPRERETELEVSTKTLCIWNYFETEISERKRRNLDPLFLNPQHKATPSSSDLEPLYPIMSTSKFFIWDRLYQRYHFKFQESHTQHLQSRSVGRKAAILQRQVEALKHSLAAAAHERKLLHTALQAALASSISTSSGQSSTDQIRQELEKLKDRQLTPSQQQNIQIQFYIKDGVVVKCLVKEEKRAESPPSATKFVPDLLKYTIEDYTLYSRQMRLRSSSQSSNGGLDTITPPDAATLAEGPLIKVQEPPQPQTRGGTSSLMDDDEYYDFDDRIARSSTVEAISGGVPMQLLSIGYSEFLKYWSKIWRARGGVH